MFLNTFFFHRISEKKIWSITRFCVVQDPHTSDVRNNRTRKFAVAEIIF